MTYIFDACALIALFKREQGYDKIRTLLDEAMASQASLSSQAAIYMHTINLLEVHYGFYRALGREKSGVILENVNVMPIKFIDSIDAVIFSEASRLKAKYAIPLGDCIGLATTVKMNGVFVTSDHHELEAVEKNETVKFFWFR